MSVVSAAALALAMLATAEEPNTQAAADGAPASQPTSNASDEALTVEQAVQLAIRQNRDLIAARLQVSVAQVEEISARVYPNPQLSYQLGNVVLGPGNTQSPPFDPIHPGAFDQPVQMVGLSEVLDVWNKRGMHIDAAKESVHVAQLLLEDALREVVYAVRSAFAEVVREQLEEDLAHQTRKRYDETVGLSRRRFQAGDISETELKKIELEGLKYVNLEIDAVMQIDLARQKLAGLLALPSAASMPGTLIAGPLPRQALALDQLIDRALSERADVRALRASAQHAELSLAAERREAFPLPTLGVYYIHSNFTIAGDNPNALGLTLSFPMPIFDRNQGGVARASVEIEHVDNDTKRLAITVRHDVQDAVRKASRARAMLDTFEAGGMLQRAESALKVAEKSYKAGAISLLELLEAQRTYLETRANYLTTLYDCRQAFIDVTHAVGGDLP